ncbi:YgdB family protein [Providencia vermicola]|uniref:YgdB family protein n=1 Tax=Providencia vermicola TaxID=333965 RepID=UPI0032DAA9C0
MAKMDSQRGNIALVMTVVLMTMSLLLMSSLHFFQRRALDEWHKETKYYHTFNRAESALAWGLTLSWETNTKKKWVCQQDATQNWKSCLKPYGRSTSIISGQSSYKDGLDIKVYQWVEWDPLKQRVTPRKNGWLDYCPVQQKGFCL